MLEGDFKENLAVMIRTMVPGFLLFAHQDKFTTAIPDLSWTGSRLTSWWDLKHANPSCESQEIQLRTMIRLDALSLARYIIFFDDDGEESTHIVKPMDFPRWKEKARSRFYGQSISRPGFNYRWVVTEMLRIHAHV